jgi:hypothetical protein
LGAPFWKRTRLLTAQIQDRQLAELALAPAIEAGDVRVQRRDRLGGVVHEYVLAA